MCSSLCHCKWLLKQILLFIVLSIIWQVALTSPASSSPGHTVAPQRFAIEPGDKTAIINDTILLACRVVNKIGNLQWTRDKFGLGTDRELKMYPRYTMTGNDEEGDYSLQIKSVSLEDDAQFQCQVGASDGVRGIVSRVATVTVYVPPEAPVIAENEIIHTTAGTRKEITCEAANGKPAAELTWLDSDGNPVPSEQVSYSTKQHPDGKRATSIAKWTVIASRHLDGKTYTCRSENPALKKPAKANIKFSVKYAPEINIATDHKYIIEGQNVTFTCNTLANPKEVIYKWYLDDKLVSTDSTTSKWTLNNVRRDLHHGSSVTCEAINIIGSNRSSYKISIQYGPVLLTPLKEMIAVTVGQSVSITCDIIGNPKPDIAWIFESPDETRVVSNEGELKISQVTYANAGTYICRGSVSGFPEITAMTKIFIKGPPTITAAPVQYALDPNSLTNSISGSSASASTSPASSSGSNGAGGSVGQGAPIRIECIIHSVPPPIRVSWTRSGAIASTIEVSSVASSPATSSSLETGSTESSVPMALNIGATGTAAAAVTSNGDSIYKQILEPIHSSSPELLRNILLISPPRDGDFDALYNCTAENEYGTAFAVISLAKQRTIPLFAITLGVTVSAITFVIIGAFCFKKDFASEKESNLHCHDTDGSSSGGHSVTGSTDLHNHHSSTRHIMGSGKHGHPGGSGVSSVSNSKNASPATGVKNIMNLTHANFTPNSDMHDSRSNGTDSDLKVEILTSSSISGDAANGVIDGTSSNEIMSNNLNNNLHLTTTNSAGHGGVGGHLHHLPGHLYPSSGHNSLPHVHTAIHSYQYPSAAIVSNTGSHTAYHTLYSHHGHSHSSHSHSHPHGHQHHPHLHPHQQTATLLQQVPSASQYWDSLMYQGGQQSQSIVNGMISGSNTGGIVVPGSISGSSNHSSSGHSPQPNVPTATSATVVASGHLVIPVSSSTSTNGPASSGPIHGYSPGPTVANSSSSMWSAGSTKAPLYQSYV